MKLKYFPDTDTLHVIFTDHEVAETKDLNENILIDLDKENKIVGMTIEHARQGNASLDFSYQTIADTSAGRTTP